MNTSIPNHIKRLFWDLDPERLDAVTHKKTIIERVLNHGDLSDWRWLVSAYGKDDIVAVLAASNEVRKSGVRKESRQLAELLLS